MGLMEVAVVVAQQSIPQAQARRSQATTPLARAPKPAFGQ